MQHQGGYIQYRCWVELGFISVVVRVASCVAPAMLVGMQGHLRPIGVVERHGGLLEFIGQIPSLGRPGVPHALRKFFGVGAYIALAASGGHEPVVPVKLGLLHAQVLRGVVGAVAHRHQYHVAGNARL